jgi:heme-degrading monooxygenase HmoA
MAISLMQAHVKNYGEWRKVFDSNAGLRKSHGAISVEVYQDIDDPDAVTIIAKWGSLEKAKKFAESAELKESQQKSGVQGVPTVFFLTET